jgi:sugar-specific transcriptional regulator TrmB
VSALETSLQDAGFTDYEAKAYVALLRKSPQTGYEIAKTSRIPRANVYAVLQKLEDRSAVTRVLQNDVIRYVAVEPELVIQRMKESFVAKISHIEKEIQNFEIGLTDHQYVESFEGYHHLISFSRQLIRTANSSLVLAMHSQEADQLSADICAATDRGVITRNLCLEGCSQPCSHCFGAFAQNPLRPSSVSEPYWFFAVSDDEHVIGAELKQGQVVGIRTDFPLLVDLVVQYIEQTFNMDALVKHPDMPRHILIELVRELSLK